jgi:hypothetical protein
MYLTGAPKRMHKYLPANCRNQIWRLCHAQENTRSLNAMIPGQVMAFHAR